MSALSEMRASALSWWAHKRDLESYNPEHRKRGASNVRRSIRGKVRHVRDACILKLHRTGFTLHAKDVVSDLGGHTTSHLDGYDDGGGVYGSLIRRLRPDVPIVDTRKMEQDALIRWAYRAPLIATGKPDDEPDNGYGGCSKVPMGMFLALADHAGASVCWGAWAGVRDDWMALVKGERVFQRIMKD